MNQSFRKRFIELNKKWMEQYGKGFYKAKGDINWEVYSEQRVNDTGGLPFFNTIELISGFCLEELDNDPDTYELINKFNTICMYFGALVNDIYSYNKEVRDGTVEKNFVFVQMKKQCISAQNAANLLVKDINSWYKKMYELGNQIKRNGYLDSKGERCLGRIDTYIDGAIAAIEGITSWNKFTPRYNKCNS